MLYWPSPIDRAVLQGTDYRNDVKALSILGIALNRETLLCVIQGFAN